ncbi:MAG: alanine:cation symporter family protein [Oceanospirillaceae bacterium]|nr:alanine:cation symporter family protein [Oceanospirillaceae bacterium]
MNSIKFVISMLMLAWANRAAAEDEASSFAGVIGQISSRVDGFFKEYLNGFVELVFFSVPVDGTQFPLIVGWLVLAAIIFTWYFGFIQVRKAKLAIDIVRGKYTDPNSTNEGEVSHFQALATALSGTIGLGNIAGVGVALAIGGPGATFWMVLCGLLGMASKFCECTLGVKYRVVLPSGAVSGGPMYYLRDGMAEIGFAGLGKVLAVGFALMCILGSLGGGNMFQANQAHAMLTYAFGVPAEYGLLTGLVLAGLVFAVISGGMTAISAVTEKIVPWMGVLYVGMSVVVIGANLDQISAAFSAIFSGAFTGAGVAGGFIGALIQGLKRATFSNEAGIGSAAIAHSAVKTKEPVTEGLVALLEPFIDTVIICTMTALVITIAGLNTAPFDGEALTGVTLTAASFTSTADIFKYLLAFAVILFAFSTMISWSYYGLKAWTFLFGEGRGCEMVFKAIFCVFIVIGATIQFGAVIDFSDAAIFAMSIFNIIGLYFLMPIVKRELKMFIAKVDSGAIKKFD